MGSATRYESLQRRSGYPRTNPYEAKSRSLAASGDFAQALTVAQEWLRDQPFALEPAQFISWLAVCGIQRPELAAEAAKRGLVANPDDWGLRNNLTVALAFLGDVPSAQNELSQIHPDSIAAERRGIYIATVGLVAFRSGQIEEGRKAIVQRFRSSSANRNPTSPHMRRFIGRTRSCWRRLNSHLPCRRRHRHSATDQAISRSGTGRKLLAAFAIVRCRTPEPTRLTSLMDCWVHQSSAD
jgi:hypothetical protein